MFTSLHAWQPLLDERRTVDGVVRSWSVDPVTRKPKVVERPAIRPVWNWPRAFVANDGIRIVPEAPV